MTDTQSVDAPAYTEQILAAAAVVHAESAARFAQLAVAQAEVYALTEGMALRRVNSWYMVDSEFSTRLTARLRQTYGEPSSDRREALAAWAQALGTEVCEAPVSAGPESLVSTSFMVAGVKVTVQIEVEHSCTCTGQCAQDAAAAVVG